MLNFKEGYLPKITNTSDLHKLKTFVRKFSLESPIHMIEELSSFMDILFGNSFTKGVLNILTEEAMQECPVEWADKMQNVLNLLGPQSPLVTRLIQNKEMLITLDKNILPHYLIDNKILQNEYISLGIKKSYQNYMLPLINWLFMRLSCAIQTSYQVVARFNSYQFLSLDDFHFHLVRNPLLILLREYLQYFRHSTKEFNRLLFSLRIYLLDQINLKQRIDHNIHKDNFGSRGSSNNGPISTHHKYQLKLHHLHAVYLMIGFARESLSEIPIYIENITDIYSQTNNSSSQLFALSLLRLWMFWETPYNSLENEVLQTLKKANPQDGWFQLKKFDPMELINQESRINYQKFNWSSNQLRGKIIRLFLKDTNWVPNFAYLHGLACFMCFISRTQNQPGRINSIITSEKNQEYNILCKVLQKIDTMTKRMVPSLQKQLKSTQIKQVIASTTYYIQLAQNKMCQYYQKNSILKSLDKQNLNPKYYENSYEQTTKKQGKSGRFGMINYCEDRQLGCWDKPLEPFEFSILHKFWYVIAYILGKIIPGTNGQPLNIRFLSNPLLFFGSFLLILIIYKILI